MFVFELDFDSANTSEERRFRDGLAVEKEFVFDIETLRKKKTMNC